MIFAATEGAQFLVFYVLKFVFMALVIALACFIGISIRKAVDKKKAAKEKESLSETGTESAE